MRKRERELATSISPPISPPLDLTTRSHLCSDLASDLTFSSTTRSQFDWIWFSFFAGFCFFCEWVWNWFIINMFTLRKCMENWVAWLCKAFSVKMFERTKHRNWFSVKWILRQPNSLNTYFFPENSIFEKYLFSGKYLFYGNQTQPNLLTKYTLLVFG